ncbi:hypothetical protein FRC12_012323 [Ceratobasidium sp. 428]|nr:hypothetical protein FRC12_012323 [Ceratobasidium sp. 428]
MKLDESSGLEITDTLGAILDLAPTQSSELLSSPIHADSVVLASTSYVENSSLVNNNSLPASDEKPLNTSRLHDAHLSIQLHSKFDLPNSCPTKFGRSVQWCADGKALLVVCEDASIEVMDVGEELDITPKLSLKHPAPVLSATWFPTASPLDPASYCFVVGVRDCPIRLIDASDGRLRASYRLVDHRERFIAPHCMAFNMYMNKLYCGFEDAIEVFDVHHPGAEGTRLHTVPTKKSRDGLRGIVSALGFAPDWSGLYAAGSYSGGIAMYTEETSARAQGWLEGVEGGIRFNPTQPHLVHAAFRHTSTIATWDIRNPAEPVSLYDRGKVQTNQRLWFDVSSDGRWLVAGDESGTMTVLNASGQSGEGAATAALVDAHQDAIGAATFHPTKPFVLSASGSRHFDEPTSDESTSDESDDTEGVEAMTSGASVWRKNKLARLGPRGPVTKDNSLKLWSCHNIS